MHELGTVFYVIEQVEKICKENELTVVGSVTLEIGEVSGIIPEFIVDCWNWARAKNELMKNAELKIETLEAVTYCEDCQKTYPQQSDQVGISIFFQVGPSHFCFTDKETKTQT